MAINKKLIHFKNKATFDTELANGNILDTSIVFIKDTKEIYTHGQIYNCDDPNLSNYVTNDILNTLLARKVDKEEGKGLSSNDYTNDDKNKLANIADNANNYILPEADETTLGGVKLGFTSKDTKYAVKKDTASKSIYVEVPSSTSLALGETEDTAYAGSKGKNNAENINKIKSTTLSHIKDSGVFTTTPDKVSLNYDCYTGAQYGGVGTAHTADIPAATNTSAGVMSAMDKRQLSNIANDIATAIDRLDSTTTSTDGTNVQVKVTQTNGKITAVNITTDNTAKNSDLTAEVTRAKAAESATQTALNNHKADKDKKHIPAGGHERQILTWKADGEAQWNDLTSMFTGLEDTLAYGVEWSTSVSDPHITRIGNMSLHKTLPIQSQLRGCIAQGDKIMYWLDDGDWHFKAGKRIPLYASVTIKSQDEHAIHWEESIKQLHISKTSSVIAQLRSLMPQGSYIYMVGSDGDTYYATIGYTLEADGVTLTGLVNSAGQAPTLNDVYYAGFHAQYRGSRARLDGYDGTVRVYCPGFYIKSKTVGSKRQVWLSTVRIDNTWTYQPEILIDAYKCTVLNKVPTDMGYLSTLPVNSAVSIANFNDYCRGGNNNSQYDKYQSTDLYRTQLGKPRTSINRATMRTYARNANSELLSYEQYKNIFYWLYVVEYANFNCQEAFNEELTAGGYHQGGLGTGVAGWGWAAWTNYNQIQPLTPCGFTSGSGNSTCVKDLVTKEGTNNLDSGTTNIPSTTFSVAKWRGFENPFGDLWTSLDGVLIETPTIGTQIPTYYIITDPSNYTDDLEGIEEKATRIVNSCKTAGIIKTWELGDSADIVPNSVVTDPNIYKCDKYNVTYTGLTKSLLVGGGVNDGADGAAGIGFIYLGGSIEWASGQFGYRTVSSSVSFPDV